MSEEFSMFGNYAACPCGNHGSISFEVEYGKQGRARTERMIAFCPACGISAEQWGDWCVSCYVRPEISAIEKWNDSYGHLPQPKTKDPINEYIENIHLKINRRLKAQEDAKRIRDMEEVDDTPWWLSFIGAMIVFGIVFGVCKIIF